jgi:hypothetical protein
MCTCSSHVFVSFRGIFYTKVRTKLLKRRQTTILSLSSFIMELSNGTCARYKSVMLCIRTRAHATDDLYVNKNARATADLYINLSAHATAY